MADMCRCRIFICNEHAANTLGCFGAVETNDLAHVNLRRKITAPVRGETAGFDDLA